MWIGEFKAWHKESVVLEVSKGVNACLQAYLLNTFEEGKNTYVLKVGVFSGPEKEKLRELFEKDPRAKTLSREGDQVFYCIKANEVFHSIVLDRNIFFVKPILMKDGFEYWTIASWRKEDLNALYKRVNRLRPNAFAEIISIKEGPLNLFLPNVLAQLTYLQRDALSLAVRGGYYAFPRKTSLEDLAKKHGVPRTTLQNHLRKAEEKIIPAVAEEITQ